MLCLCSNLLNVSGTQMSPVSPLCLPVYTSILLYREVMDVNAFNGYSRINASHKKRSKENNFTAVQQLKLEPVNSSKIYNKPF